jgi:hypothetical protein
LTVGSSSANDVSVLINPALVRHTRIEFYCVVGRLGAARSSVRRAILSSAAATIAVGAMSTAAGQTRVNLDNDKVPGGRGKACSEAIIIAAGSNAWGVSML